MVYERRRFTDGFALTSRLVAIELFLLSKRPTDPTFLVFYVAKDRSEEPIVYELFITVYDLFITVHDLFVTVYDLLQPLGGPPSVLLSWGASPTRPHVMSARNHERPTTRYLYYG